MKLISRCLCFFLFLFSSWVYADYTLGTGDIVRVTVYGDADLIREVRIADGGVLTFPLIGEVEVGGLTSVQAEKRIAEKLKLGGYIANPQVSVLVTQFMSKSVSVLGGVFKPGRYAVSRPTNIEDIIAEAGGLVPDASEIITVIRGNQRSIYDLNSVLEKRNLSPEEVRLTGNETVYISVRDVTVSGQVLRPSKYGIQGGVRKITDFLAVAGGATELAGETLFFTTTSSGSSITKEIDIDTLFKSPTSEINQEAMPGDVIYVPKAPQVYVYGEVQRPGNFKIEKNMTVMQTIAKAGGLTIRGTQRSVKLYRKSADGSIVKSTPDLSVTLQNDDVLFIEESLL